MRMLVFGFSILVSASVAAEEHGVALEALRALVPGTTVESLRPVPDSDLLEAVIDGNVVYVSTNGRYVVSGVLVDVGSRRDLAEVRRSELRREILGAAPRSERMVYAPEETRHRVTVFTDIDCGYCRRLHQQIPEYNALGIAIDYRFLPRSGIDSPSHHKASFAWCAAEPRKALDLAMSGTDPSPASCDDPVAEDFELARKLRLNGTPMLITEDGELIPTYLPPEQLAARLAGR